MDDCFKVVVALFIVLSLWGFMGCGGGDPAEPSWSVVYDLRDGGNHD